MQIFPRHPKEHKPGAFYYGEFTDQPLAPFSISVASFSKDYGPEKPHYHTKNQKVYLTLEGEGILNVNGQPVIMKPEEMIHLEPNDIHFVEKVTRAPIKYIVILSSKTNDKVVID